MKLIDAEKLIKSHCVRYTVSVDEGYLYLDSTPTQVVTYNLQSGNWTNGINLNSNGLMNAINYIKEQTKGKIRVDVSSIDVDELPETVDGLIYYLNKALLSIPVDHRPHLNFEIKKDWCYPEHYDNSLHIYYNRHETDEEMRRRSIHEADRQHRREAIERGQLAKLKEKYE